MTDKANVAIIGASGYTGGELMRLLLNHPRMTVSVATSRRLAGKPVVSVHRHLTGLTDLEFTDPDIDAIKEQCDAVFLAVPHGTAMDVVPGLIGSGLNIVDLSADYRLPAAVFEKVYGMPHKDPREAVFGLPELHPEVRDESFVANPGCYPTGAILAAAPLADADLLETAVFDSKSGITGAGISPSAASHYPNMAENVQPYKLTTHRHCAEIRQEIAAFGGNCDISFTPHVIPAIRGILTTAHLFTGERLSTGDVRDIYGEFYAGCPFVRLVDGMPSLGAVRGSNFCHIGFEADQHNRRIVVVSVIDNLVKGASGQAIQNMNLMCGFGETAGLRNAGLGP
jgi:N-acetyl-gamma-glutamyl-phosphate reductase